MPKDNTPMRVTNSKRGQLILYPMLIGMGLFILSCEDIIEKNITDKELIVIAPGNNIRTSFSTQTFWWEYMDGALKYTLQVVSPSFAAVEKVVLDTTITLNKFTFNLFPGNFEWRVGAQNGSYITPFIVSTLQIDSTMDLKSQKVTLTSPIDNGYTNSVNTLFQWQKLYNADNYSIEVHSTDWNGDVVFSSLPVAYDTLTVKNLTDGVYSWGIKAWNSNSATNFSTHIVTIDRLKPGIPALLEPADKAKLLQLPVNLTWDRASDTGSPLTDSIVVSTDSLFRSNKIVVAKFIQDKHLNDAVKDTGT